MIFDKNIRNRIADFRDTLDAGSVYTIAKAGERRTYHTRIPDGRLSVRIERGCELRVGRRTVRVVLQIVLTGPLQLDGNSGYFRYLHGLADKVSAATASKPSSKIDSVDLNLLRRKP